MSRRVIRTTRRSAAFAPDHSIGSGRSPSSGRRLVVIGAIVVAMFAGLVTRLLFLQVAGGQQLAIRAHQNRERFVSVPALRGTILDRNGVILAQTVPVSALTIDRQQLTQADRRRLEASLGALLGIDAAEVDRRIDDPRVPPYLPVPIVENFDLPSAVYVAEHREKFPGVDISRIGVRTYPNGPLTADVIGYTGQINSDELAVRRFEGYTTDDTIGKTGIEQTFESQLRGAPGKDRFDVDVDGRITRTSILRQPRAGNDVQLTLDLDLQRVAAESLQQGMDGARTLVDPDSGERYRANAGTVVVLDARDGSVVAMTSNPSYDPNDFVAGTADKYFDDPAKPLINRALNAYAPGSTFKSFTAIAMLENAIRSPDEPLDDEGCFKFGGEGEQRCNARRTPYGTVDLRRALTVSSDVYFYNVGNSFWNLYRDEGGDATTTHPAGSGMQRAARAFGFGEPTRIALPGDQPGRVPDHAFRVALNKDNAADQAWRRGDSASLAVGQGDVLVSPLQLADAYAAFANGGMLRTPRVVSAVRANSAGLERGTMGAVINPIDAQTIRSISLPPEVRQPIIDGLSGVVSSTEGTASGAFRGYQGVGVIGKTGTAQRAPNQDTSWFVAVTNPDDDPSKPQYVVVAMVEQGGFGANVAAPIVRRIIDSLNGNPKPDPVVVAPPTGNEQAN